MLYNIWKCLKGVLKMSKLRKYISFLLIIMIGLLLNTGFVPVPRKDAALNTVTTKPVPFTDIAGHWAEAAISEMYLKDIMKGHPDNTFKPNNPITKIQAVVMLVRVMGLEPNEELADDLPYLQETFNIPRWANGYVLTALNERLIQYNELETIGSQKPLARQDAARLLTRALGLSEEAEKKDAAGLKFIDAGEIKPDFAGYVSVAVEKGLMSGNVEGAFLPLNPVTRAQIAVMFSRADALLPEHEREVVGAFVYALADNKPEISLTKDDIPLSVKMADQYLLFKDDKTAGWQDLLAGDSVKVIKNSQDEGVLVLATSAPKPEEKAIPFEILKLEAESVVVQNFVAENKIAENYLILKQDGYLYLLVTRGEKPNFSYSVEITKITGVDKDRTRDLVVTVVKTDPKPGTITMPVLSYRYALVKLPLDGNEPGRVTFVNETGTVLKQIP